MPGYERAELTAELKIVSSQDTEGSTGKPVEAVKRVAGESGLAREAGPGLTILAGGRQEVLEAMTGTVEAALDAGAHAVEVRVEAEGDAPRFDRG